MGNQCQGCATPDVANFELLSMKLEENMRPAFEEMNILEYEQRIKMYAHPANNGKISILQLKEGFAGTKIFSNLSYPQTLTHKVFVCPFFQDF